MQNPNLITQFIVGAAIALGGWHFVANATDSNSTGNTATEPAPVSGVLDGLIFIGALGPDGKPKDTPDSFVFQNGTFVSKECELRCQYPARPYFVRVNGSKTEFISETKCPYKDAKIVWRGSVEGNRIMGKSTWIVKRWYWTYENTFEFEGEIAEKSTSAASTE